MICPVCNIGNVYEICECVSIAGTQVIEEERMDNTTGEHAVHKWIEATGTADYDDYRFMEFRCYECNSTWDSVEDLMESLGMMRGIPVMAAYELLDNDARA